MNANKIRMPLDISMTILSVILMGGAYFFPQDIVHEILGAALFALWAVHIALNRRWYGAIFKGKYNARRILQTAVNCGILVCVILLMISGTILSNHVFAFLEIESGLGFARVAHLLASHWYFLFMSLHIGLHVGMVAGKAGLRADGRISIALKILVALASIYGAYAFVVRGVWRYLILDQQFFFLDLELGYALFFVDYLAIIALFAAASHYAAKILRNRQDSAGRR